MIDSSPPHADSAARAAAELADPGADPVPPGRVYLVAIQTSAKLVQLLRKPAFTLFTGGPPNAPRVYEEMGAVVADYGIPACPVILPDRAAYRHASAAGASVAYSRA